MMEGIQKVSEKALLKVLGNNRLELGDKVRFMGVLKEPLPNTNPKLFNYKLSLLADNIHTTITIKDYSILDIDKRIKFYRDLRKDLLVG